MDGSNEGAALDCTGHTAVTDSLRGLRRLGRNLAARLERRGLIVGSGASIGATRTRRLVSLRWLLLALLLPLNVVWNESGSLPPIAYPPLSAPILVTSVSAGVAGDASTVTVEVSVRNTSSSARQGRVWWQLSEASGPAGTFDRRVYESGFRDVDLEPARETRLTWTEQPQVLAATYEVDAWARVGRGSTLVPSDGRSAPTSVRLDPGRLDLLRRGPPRAGVGVVALLVTETTSPAGGRLEVHLESRSDRLEQGWLKWTTADLGGRALGDWWRWAGSGRNWFQHFVVGAGDTLVVPLQPVLPLGPDDHGVRISLEVEQSAAVDRVLWPDDDVLALVRLPGPPPAQR